VTAPAAARAGRYTIVGAICALTHNAIMICGDLIHIHYIPLFLISFCIVTLLGYLLHALYTFKEPASFAPFARFAGASVTGGMLSFFITVVVCSGLKQSVAVATLTATCLLFAYNYICTHWAIYGRLSPRSFFPYLQ
jgi:putative flippase GtrA